MLDGYSVIVDPNGAVLAGPLVREEGILYATLDLDAARARRRLFDPVGHYNRPDVFRLVVDDRPKPHLVSLARAEPVPAAPLLVGRQLRWRREARCRPGTKRPRRGGCTAPRMTAA